MKGLPSPSGPNTIMRVAKGCPLVLAAGNGQAFIFNPRFHLDYILPRFLRRGRPVCFLL